MSRAEVERLRSLHSLHGAEQLLVLPNAWDVLSARLVERAGARAVATSSAAVAWARGHADGQRLPLVEVLELVRAITRVVSVPVSVDFERGYGTTPGEVAEAVARVVDAGAAGINLEDGGGAPAAFAATVRAVKQRLGDDVFVNARTCIVLHGATAEAHATGSTGASADAGVTSVVEEVLARGRAYAEAGADGFFVPGLVDAGVIARVAAGCSLPLNVMLRPGLPSPSELRRLGVRRLSVATRLAELAYGAMQRATVQLLGEGSYGSLTESALGYGETNALFP